MREIKFRAWDLDEEEYTSWHSLERIVYNQDYYRMNNISDKSLNAFTDTRIILEQYTGLKDKNGQEIYEGDIVKSFLGMGQIVYGGCGFYIDCDDVVEGWEADADKEVIGNIHENPEFIN